VRRALRGLGLCLLLALAALAAGVALSPYADGPLGPIPGGPLSGRVAHERDPDWSAAAARGSLELEVNPEDPRSLTVWPLVVGGELYVPAGFAERERWPREVVADGRVVLRVGDVLYERQAVRVEEPEVRAALRAALAREHAVPEGDDPRTWFFRMDPRAP
jgi:hypothetical protein